MSLTIWRFAALLLPALLMGASFCHSLEMPLKLRAGPELWMTYQHTLYAAFAIVGGPIELGSILTVSVLAYRVRGRRPAFPLTLTAALLLALAFALWLALTATANAETAKWTADQIPADWASWRAQWELSHLIRFGLHLIAFSALALAVLLELKQARTDA